MVHYSSDRRPKKGIYHQGKHYEMLFGILYTMWHGRAMQQFGNGCTHRVHSAVGRDMCQSSLENPVPTSGRMFNPKRYFIWTQP
jgi:hypothetical protein